MKRKSELIDMAMSIITLIADKLRKRGYVVTEPKVNAEDRFTCYAEAMVLIKCDIGLVEIRVYCESGGDHDVYIFPYDDEYLDSHRARNVNAIIDAYRVAQGVLEGAGATISVEFTYWAKKEEE